MFLSLLLAGCPTPEVRPEAAGDTATEETEAADTTAFDTGAACAAGEPILYGEVRDASGACTVCASEDLVLVGVAWNPCEAPVTLTYGCFIESVGYANGSGEGMDGVSDCDGPNTMTLDPGERYEEEAALPSPATSGTWTWSIEFGHADGTRAEGTFTVR